MAQHDLTDLVTRINAIGGDLDQLIALDDVEQARNNVAGIPAVFAWNRKAFAAAHDLVERMERRAPRTTARAAATPAPLATEKQVAYATSLIANRIRSGEEGGHISFAGSYPTGEQLAAMTRRDISTLINDLRSAYNY